MLSREQATLSISEELKHIDRIGDYVYTKPCDRCDKTFNTILVDRNRCPECKRKVYRKENEYVSVTCVKCGNSFRFLIEVVPDAEDYMCSDCRELKYGMRLSTLKMSRLVKGKGYSPFCPRCGKLMSPANHGWNCFTKNCSVISVSKRGKFYQIHFDSTMKRVGV